MDEGEFVEQPLTGFSYSYWFGCVACGTRVNIAADLYERQTNRPHPHGRRIFRVVSSVAPRLM